MIIKFYGTRGSIPICNKEFLDFGGNTSCIAISLPDTDSLSIIDAGTGIRNLGKELMARGGAFPNDLTIGFSHFHWDHIQGFPFFDPAYSMEAKINILAMGKGWEINNLKNIFAEQMRQEYFPVKLDEMGASFRFLTLGSKVTQHSNGMAVTAKLHNHPGGAYSFRIERNGKVMVVCTDIEHGDGIDPAIVDLARNADLLIHEAQYTNEELEKKRGWGHSSFDQAMQVAEMAGVKRLIMTHHDPDHDDAFLMKMEKKCQQRFPDCELSREGMEIEL